MWSPLAGGLLSGKYRRDSSPSGQTRQLSGEWNEPPVRDQEKLYDTVEVLVDVAGAHGVSPAQVALAWLLGKPAVTSLIIGARTDEQLRDNLGAAALSLTADERAALDKVSAPALIYPYWHQLARPRTAWAPPISRCSASTCEARDAPVNPETALQLADWRRQTAALYTRVRDQADPAAAHALWRDGRDRLMRSHPQSPLPAGRPAARQRGALLAIRSRPALDRACRAGHGATAAAGDRHRPATA